VSVRLDVAVVAAGQARSRSHAAELIRAGRVQLNGRVVTRPGHPVRSHDRVTTQTDPWVSRAAHKLLGALDASGVTVPHRVLDAGASTGGFTQVLLSRGAREVYAVDVGHDQLAGHLRDDPRVRVRERLNLRDLTLAAHLDDRPVDLVVADVSFISLRLLLRPLFGVLTPAGQALLMIKPQFEVGRERLGPGGVVHSATDRSEAIEAVLGDAAELGWQARWRSDSALPGPAGNVEHFACFERPPADRPD